MEKLGQALYALHHLNSQLYKNSIKRLSQYFPIFHNKRHDRRGTLWGERFKSLIVENGETLVSCLADIDLNPIRAGLVDRPEEYRWNATIGYHMQTENKDKFLSMDFGLKAFTPEECFARSRSEFHRVNIKSKKERVRRYRRYVYEAWAIKHPGKTQGDTIDDNILKKERESNFEISRTKRFRYKTRYFTDSGIIGTKEFVSQNYQRFKHVFQCKHEKKPKPIKGLDGVYSLKRLVEA